MQIIKTITSDGLHLTGLHSGPLKKDTVIIQVHGMAGDPYTNSFYPIFHEIYTQNGLGFISIQLRGTGSITMFFKEPDQYPNIGNSFEIFEECVYDIDAWIKVAKNLGYKKIILQGHSLGTSKVVYYLNKTKSKDVKGIILISPTDMLGFVMNETNYNELIKKASALAERNLPKELIIEGPYEYILSAQTVLNFFTPESNCNIFCYTGRPHNWTMANEINVPALLISGTKDEPITDLCDPQVAMETLQKNLKNSPKVKTIIYKNATHDFAGFENKLAVDISDFTLQITSV